MGPDLSRYRLAFDLSPVPLLLVDSGGVIQLANRELEEMFGYGPEVLIGQPVECLLPQNLRQKHPELRAAFGQFPSKRRMGQGRDLDGETRDGRLLPLELGLQPVTEGDETWALVTAVDTSTRRETEAVARATLEAAASAMIMVDRAGLIVSVNRAGCDLFGYAEDALIGQPVEMLLPPDLRDKHRVYRTSFFEVGTPRAMAGGAQLYGRHKNGTDFRLEAALTPVEIGNRRLVLATIVDLSERLAAERAIAGQQAAEAQASRLARLNDELTRFAYSASHDLKAPLSTITGMLRLCIEDISLGETAEAVANMQKLIELSERSAHKVEGMLRLARIGNEVDEMAIIDLRAIATEAWQAATLHEAAPPTFEIAEDHSGDVLSHPQALETILENLLSNALKFRDPTKASWVRLSTRQDREWIEIEVADNGVGFPNDRAEEIFGMFRTLSSKPGDGLGLAIVRRFVDILGGKINCFGEDGVGASFTIRLPMKTGAFGSDHSDGDRR